MDLFEHITSLVSGWSDRCEKAEAFLSGLWQEHPVVVVLIVLAAACAVFLRTALRWMDDASLPAGASYHHYLRRTRH